MAGPLDDTMDVGLSQERLRLRLHEALAGSWHRQCCDYAVSQSITLAFPVSFHTKVTSEPSWGLAFVWLRSADAASQLAVN
jgi:hypothetical protein